MKTFLLTLAFSLLSFLPVRDADVKITGNIDLHPGETTVLTAMVQSVSSCVYEWEILDEDKLERNFSFVRDGNTLTVTHLGKSQYGLADICCRVYTASGSLVGVGWVEIVVQP